jgi:ubiquinone/menaquinone biosynthesis C-methylase UbiE
VAVDLATHMLAIAAKNVQAAGFSAQIRLMQVDAKALDFDDASFVAVISNSIVHHIPEPRSVLTEIVRVTATSGRIFVRDLMRPADDQIVGRLVETYAGQANSHQRQMFNDSLRAALDLAEIRQLVAELGFEPQSVQATSDRHWTWNAQKAIQGR